MPETQNIEYKSVWKDEYLRWICGFANAQGGRIFIGKDNDGNIVGVKNAKKLLEDLPNKITSILGIVADVNLHKTEQGDYIEIAVESQFNAVNYKGEYHFRSGSTKQELKGAALDNFLLKKQGKHWDSVSIPNVAIEDLSLIALQRFRNEAAKSGRVDEEVLNDDTKHLLQDLHLIDNDSGNLKRAAILLFHHNPEKFVTGAYIKIGFFQSDDDELAFQDEIHGSLMEQIDKAFDLLKSKYIVYAISYEGVSRREKPTFPIAALRESLLNAIAHKDYASGIPIQISVYSDRIVFWNSGELPRAITIEKLLQKHPSIPYNPDIANTLFRSGDIETWGRGYRKIIKSVLKNKQLPPMIRNVGGIMLTYYTNTHTQLKAENMDGKTIQIIEYVIANGSINNSEVQKLLNMSKPTATRLLKQAEKWLEMKNVGRRGVEYYFKQEF
ncbi:MAG: putative DNA binding domain-containing protein [Bacteroidales bacterium]|jgi:ATP-dependent DNA helicase RecG|nr:putative DNA binding domain-containing protein [Bacteroidales bacterium]